MGNVNRLEVVWKQTDKLTEASFFERICDLLLTNIKTIRISPLPFLVGIVVSAAVIAAVGIVLSLVLNLTSSLGSSQKKLPVSIYLNDNLTNEDKIALQVKLEAANAVESVNFISKSAALSFFENSVAGDTTLVQGLKENNPLPASFEVLFKDQNGMKQFLSEIAPVLRKDKNVSSVEADESLSGALQRGLSSLSILLWGGGVVLILIAACVIASAIALILHAHKREIEVLSLVGAKQSFIQIPYIIEGALQGIIGGILGVLTAISLQNLVTGIFTDSGALKLFQFSGFSFSLMVFLVFIGGAIGAFASWVCVKRTIKV